MKVFSIDSVELLKVVFAKNSIFRIDNAFAKNHDDVSTTCFSLLRQWNDEMTSQNRDSIYPLCTGLSCIGRENLSQDVARKCDPFVLEGKEKGF